MLICFFLITALGLFVYLKKFATLSILTYPPNTNCEQVSGVFESYAVFQKFAQHDKQPTLD